MVAVAQMAAASWGMPIWTIRTERQETAPPLTGGVAMVNRVQTIQRMIQPACVRPDLVAVGEGQPRNCGDRLPEKEEDLGTVFPELDDKRAEHIHRQKHAGEHYAVHYDLLGLEDTLPKILRIAAGNQQRQVGISHSRERISFDMVSSSFCACWMGLKRSPP